MFTVFLHGLFRAGQIQNFVFGRLLGFHYSHTHTHTHKEKATNQKQILHGPVKKFSTGITQAGIAAGSRQSRTG
jgi:hypothetical protein